MNIFSEYSLGFFNLWLLMVFYPLPILLTIILRKRIFQSTTPRFSRSRSSREYYLFVISKILMLVYFLYAILIPIHYDTSISLIGLIIYIIGFAYYSAAWITIAKSEKGELFTNGPYQYSRHPIYISSVILFIGAGLISQSWFFLGFSIVVGISHMHNALAEEQICLEVFGDDYRYYMARTPRWLGRPAQKSKNTNQIL